MTACLVCQWGPVDLAHGTRLAIGALEDKDQGQFANSGEDSVKSNIMIII
jgi:hypothetical protein